MENETEFAYLKKDVNGHILVNNENVTCVTKDGIEIEIKYDEIDFTCDNVQFYIDNRRILVPLHENTENEKRNEESNAILNKENIVESFRWCDATTKLFLSMYKDAKELLTNRKIKNKKMLWDKISLQMQQNGYNLSAIQVENKYKSLERSYKNMILNNKKTGRGRISCPYETELTDLLGSKHNIEPLAVSGRHGLIVKKKMTNTTLSMDDTTEPDILIHRTEETQETKEQDQQIDHVQTIEDHVQTIEDHVQTIEDHVQTIEDHVQTAEIEEHIQRTKEHIQTIEHVQPIEEPSTSKQIMSNNVLNNVNQKLSRKIEKKIWG